MSPTPKATSVTAEGQPDGFAPAAFFRPEVRDGGLTRLVVSLPGDRLVEVHRALVEVVEPPLGVLYVRLTDRRAGQLPRPEKLVAVDIPRERVLGALDRAALLVGADGRAQVWVRGALGEQVVVEETGVVFAYPDDPLFRDVLSARGIPERAPGEAETMGDRGYVRVSLRSDCDVLEERLVADLGLVRRDG